ncbi:MAG TPA: hypothetical protein VJB16_06730, partial [archaeon]|nr:hypothetical protein [archaeon]
NLAHNKLRSVAGMGLESCEVLEVLNLSFNALSRKVYRVLYFIPTLKSLMLKGNPELGPDYRAEVLQECKHFFGNNRMPGLIAIDKSTVSLEERLEVLRSNPKTARVLPSAQWLYILQERYGALVLRSREHRRGIFALDFNSRGLEEVNISRFESLVSLNLSANQLRDVAGLEALTHLAYLNLSENSKLNLGAVLKRLSNTSALVAVSLGVFGVSKSPLFVGQKAYRAQVLGLLEHHPLLLSIDDTVISIDERVATYASVFKKDPNFKPGRYRFNLLVALSEVPYDTLRRLLHPSDLVPSKLGLNLAKIVALESLCDSQLESRSLEFSPFAGLCRLNLSRNQLTSLVGLGLESLKKLSVL